MKTYSVDVTVTVEVTLDETKFTPEFLREFNGSITDFGGRSDDTFPAALEEHAKHLAWVHATGVEDLDYHSNPPFVEGYGPVDELGIKARVTDTATEVL